MIILKTVLNYFIFCFVEVFIEFVTALLLVYVLVFGLKACGILASSDQGSNLYPM